MSQRSHCECHDCTQARISQFQRALLRASDYEKLREESERLVEANSSLRAANDALTNNTKVLYRAHGESLDIIDDLKTLLREAGEQLSKHYFCPAKCAPKDSLLERIDAALVGQEPSVGEKERGDTPPGAKAPPPQKD